MDASTSVSPSPPEAIASDESSPDDGNVDFYGAYEDEEMFFALEDVSHAAPSAAPRPPPSPTRDVMAELVRAEVLLAWIAAANNEEAPPPSPDKAPSETEAVTAFNETRDTQFAASIFPHLVAHLTRTAVLDIVECASFTAQPLSLHQLLHHVLVPRAAAPVTTEIESLQTTDVLRTNVIVGRRAPEWEAQQLLWIEALSKEVVHEPMDDDECAMLQTCLRAIVDAMGAPTTSLFTLITRLSGNFRMRPFLVRMLCWPSVQRNVFSWSAEHAAYLRACEALMPVAQDTVFATLPKDARAIALSYVTPLMVHTDGTDDEEAKRFFFDRAEHTPEETLVIYGAPCDTRHALEMFRTALLSFTITPQRLALDHFYMHAFAKPDSSLYPFVVLECAGANVSWADVGMREVVRAYGMPTLTAFPWSELCPTRANCQHISLVSSILRVVQPPHRLSNTSTT